MGLSKQKELKELIRGESLYIIKEIIGTSKKSWEDATKQALEIVLRTLEDHPYW
jgi:flavin-binding protein dodecin